MLLPSSLPADVLGEAPASRVQQDARDAAGAALVASGRVPPGWRRVERGIRDAYHPPLEAVSSAPPASLLVRQALRNAPAGPARTRNEPVPVPGGGPDGEPAGVLDLEEQFEASHQATRRPIEWRSVEIEARLQPDGSVDALRVVRASGSARLDQIALEAVGRVLRQGPLREIDDLRVARFRVSAAVVVVPLDLNPLGTPQSRARGRGVVAKLRFNFDETNGSVKAEKPFSEELRTDVKLISLSKAP